VSTMMINLVYILDHPGTVPHSPETWVGHEPSEVSFSFSQRRYFAAKGATGSSQQRRAN
jgi:hypothetical protein